MVNKNSAAEILKRMKADVENITEQAAVMFKEKVHEDLQDAAKQSVDLYYRYKNGWYTKYGRQHNLYHTYTVSSEISRSGDIFSVNTEVFFDAAHLEDLYESNSQYHQIEGMPWKRDGALTGTKSGPPNPVWIFSNFMSGYHPWTNGWPLGGAKELRVKKIKKSPSPDKFLTDYMDSYHKRYADKYLEDIIVKLLKNYIV